ncbi:DUF3883 domain-containing protein [Lysinibacillus sp. LZ02]|uniref:DUF3883 domain-containing protein n=1 Tax=Lysinibacillus sp. LZ02 TaxID=3420668 RepID=UPI003D35BAD2
MSFTDTVKQLSLEFIQEGLNSPNLLADMAAMELYMAESYGQRIFIELLQNADDALATKFLIFKKGKHIFVANNGKPFDDNDLKSICRSGASTKERGKNIGYRGIGFKSTTHLSNNIIIHSNNCTFTFSKVLASQQLNMSINQIPTIRIPFVIENLTFEIESTIQQIVSAGYNTIFIFCDSNSQVLDEEVELINGDYFIFLKNIKEVSIQLDTEAVKGLIKRENDEVSVEFKKEFNLWKVINGEKSQLAFKLDENKNIVQCNKEQSLFHCYLPTYENTPYPFKINADFSTDPSRKHITIDDRTMLAIKEAANIIFGLIKKSIMESNKFFSEVIQLLKDKQSFSKLSLLLIKETQERLFLEWIPMKSGHYISAKDYVKKPLFLDDAEWNWIREIVPSKHTVPNIDKDNMRALDLYLNTIASNSYSLMEWIEILSDYTFVEQCSDKISFKIYAYLFKNFYVKNTISKEDFRIDTCYLKVENEVFLWKEATNHQVERSLINIAEHLSSTEIDWIIKYFRLPIENKFKIASMAPSEEKKGGLITPNITKSITKWRSAEQQCMEFEKIQGNLAQDVSKQNLGYDIRSITPKNENRYIEVKSVKYKGQKISLTNNEYTAAHQFEDNYYLCIVYQDEQKINFEYIKNPLKNVFLEKVVRQWEWICEEYQGEVYSITF